MIPTDTHLDPFISRSVQALILNPRAPFLRKAPVAQNRTTSAHPGRFLVSTTVRPREAEKSFSASETCAYGCGSKQKVARKHRKVICILAKIKNEKNNCCPQEEHFLSQTRSFCSSPLEGASISLEGGEISNDAKSFDLPSKSLEKYVLENSKLSFKALTWDSYMAQKQTQGRLIQFAILCSLLLFGLTSPSKV